MMRRLFCLTLVLAATTAIAQEEVDPPLPKLPEMQFPTTEELLGGRPVDWVVLVDGQQVLFVEPLQPRPGTLAELATRYEASLKWPKPRNKEEQREQTEKRALLQRLTVVLADGSGESEYLLEVRLIEQILYFEDLILKRAGLLLDENQTGPAYELLMLVNRRQARWPGASEVLQRFHFVEAGLKLTAGQPEACLRSLESLASINAQYEGLSERAGEAVERLVQVAVDAGDFRAARHFLARLNRLNAEHVVGARWRGILNERAQTLMTAARTAAEAGDLSTATATVDMAARIWPEAAGLRDQHRSLYDTHPVLKTGVLALSGESPGYPFPTRADLRTRRLTELQLFEPNRMTDSGVRYRSAVCEEWEPADLGRELRLHLRARRAPWESRTGITSFEIQRTLQRRLDPASPLLDPRLANLVAGVEATSPWDITIRFRNPPLRPEALLALPIEPPALDSPLMQDVIPELKEAVAAAAPEMASRFWLWKRSENSATYRRLRQPDPKSRQRYVTEIVEHRYPSWERSLQALLRGEADVLPTSALADARRLQEDPRFFTVPYAIPETHLLQLNPRSPQLQNGPLRRAVLAAIPREQILQEIVLKDADPAWGRLTISPVASRNPVYNRVLTQPGSDPLLSASLLLTSRKELDVERITLRLAHPGDADVLRLCTALIEAWKRVGLDVELCDPRVKESAQSWDLAYRVVQLADPALELWPLVTGTNQTELASLTPLPDRLRRSLLSIEQAGDGPTATALIQQLQSDMLAEVRWIPLWEVDQFWIARKRLGGIPSPLLHPYQQVEKWIVQSWFPQEVP